MDTTDTTEARKLSQKMEIIRDTFSFVAMGVEISEKHIGEKLQRKHGGEPLRGAMLAGQAIDWLKTRGIIEDKEPRIFSFTEIGHEIAYGDDRIETGDYIPMLNLADMAFRRGARWATDAMTDAAAQIENEVFNNG